MRAACAIMAKMANLAKIVNIADICQNSHDTAKGFFQRRKCGIWRKFAKVLLKVNDIVLQGSLTAGRPRELARKLTLC